MDTQDSPLDARPASRRGKAKARQDNIEETVMIGEPSSSKDQQIKEKKKPRKLERRSVVLQEPVITLDTRVERLERQFASLSSRVDTVEVRQVRRPTAATYRRSSSTSTRATSAARARPRGSTPRNGPRHAGGNNSGRPSLADQLRESQRLRRTHQRQKSGDNSIEEIPRSALVPSQSRQVALTGQYNIPLPSTLSTEDILNIKSGLTAAGSIARSLASALTAPSTRDAGTSGTAGTPRDAGAGISRSSGPTRSGGKPDSTVDHPQQDRMPMHHGEDDKENVFGAGQGNASSSGVGVTGAGNALPEEHDIIGAESASRTWRSFVLQAGGVVASAAKDAAVEFSTQAQDPHPADNVIDVTDGRPETASSARVGSVRSSSTKSRRTRTASRAVSEVTDAGSPMPTARRRPKVSRTSSRASSRV